MQRRSFLTNSSILLGILALQGQSSLANFLQDPAWKIKMLTDKVGVFTEKGGTILFQITKEGIVVVDSQFPDSAQHLIDELKKQHPQPFRLLINTHHHGDHSSGNIAFKGLTQHTLAHANSKLNQQAVAIKNNNEDKQLYPDQTFEDKWCEKIGKDHVCLHYLGAGHTNGDSLVQLQESNIVHMGDLVFNRRHPFIDRTAGANIANWIVLLEKATNTFSKKTTYVSGHAGNGYDITMKADDVLRFRDYLGNLMKFVSSELKAGKTKEEILKATEIPGSPEWKGDGISRPLTAAFEELSV
ncbi:MAG: MBL fold metallo-hydrolase [Chitinophagaceae bacterium]|nr:MAG: MBL fold metallo-hydrolase [Chitinophagaceae bacterium]